MEGALSLKGLHHLTAVSADIRTNYRFYTETMGMRLVKRSVNQDDVRAYHLFYADAVGSPGTDVTFFDWAVPSEQRGSRSIVRTHLRVNGSEALAWWEGRLAEVGVRSNGVTERDDRLVLDFEDPEGQRLTLIDDGGAGVDSIPWMESAVPPEHQIRGLGPVVLSVPRIDATEVVLTRVMGMQQTRIYRAADLGMQRVVVFEMGGGGPHAEVHVAVQPREQPARPGAGGVHHVAFRTPNESEYEAWVERLDEIGIPNSGRVNRYYFKSLYFREPNGILFEIATDGPGFAVDEDPEHLGESIALPPFLEPRREEIEANLKSID
ncbi:MAG: ring-cleaving dioxygenase [Rhodothermales bacterium]